MLDGVRPGMDDGSAQLLDHFAAAKGRLDAAGEAADLVGWRGWLGLAWVGGWVGGWVTWPFSCWLGLPAPPMWCEFGAACERGLLCLFLHGCQQDPPALP